LFYSISILLLLWAFSDGLVVMWEMILFVILYIIYVVCTKYRSTWLSYDAPELIQLDDEIETIENKRNGIVVFILHMIEKTL
jgi:Ca2+/Na+ antiporter